MSSPQRASSARADHHTLNIHVFFKTENKTIQVPLLQVRKSPEGIECRALQLTTDHNLSVPEVREQYIAEHADMPDAVVCKRGTHRVKGKITVSMHSFIHGHMHEYSCG